VRSLVLTAAVILLSATAHAQKFTGTCSKGDACKAIYIEKTEGKVSVAISNGYGFAGDLVGGGAPMFFSSDILLPDGREMKPKGNGGGCHFYFTNGGGTFTQGWESRLTTVECDIKVEFEGQKIFKEFRFDVTKS